MPPISVSSTYFGTDRGTRDFSPNATTLSADTTETGIRNQIALLEQENENLKKERNHEGVIYFPTQQAIASNKSRIEALQNRLNDKETGRESDNKEIQKQHLADSMRKEELEKQINALKTTDNLQKEELLAQLRQIEENEKQRIAHKKAHIDSLRNIAVGMPLNLLN